MRPFTVFIFKFSLICFKVKIFGVVKKTFMYYVTKFTESSDVFELKSYWLTGFRKAQELSGKSFQTPLVISLKSWKLNDQISLKPVKPRGFQKYANFNPSSECLFTNEARFRRSF